MGRVPCSISTRLEEPSLRIKGSALGRSRWPRWEERRDEASLVTQDGSRYTPQRGPKIMEFSSDDDEDDDDDDDDDNDDDMMLDVVMRW
jgi:hypothetical protein